MMSDQCLVMLKQKTMDKEVMDKVGELKIKEGKEKRLRRFQDTLTVTKRTTQKIIEKEQKKPSLIKCGLLLQLKLLTNVSKTISK
jgi:hypothetical protein